MILGCGFLPLASAARQRKAGSGRQNVLSITEHLSHFGILL